MSKKLLASVTAILLAGLLPVLAAAEPVCPPGCTCICEGGLLGYECQGGGQPHFIIGDNDELTEVKNVNASFSVAGLTVSNLTIGNTVFAPFTIGSSESRVRFTTSNGGECVQVSNLKGFVNPSPIVVDNRALTVLKTGAFFCHEPGVRDLMCFPVKGQVGAPFPDLACTPDRVEFVCGVVS